MLEDLQERVVALANIIDRKERAAAATGSSVEQGQDEEEGEEESKGDQETLATGAGGPRQLDEYGGNDDNAAKYLLRYGLWHAAKAGRVREAANELLLDFEVMLARAQRS